MTLTELRYIVAVARERHFGRAAEACHVSQPTLSVAIKKLEEELGAQIFERTSAEVAMTALGILIVEQAQRVSQTLARLSPTLAAALPYRPVEVLAIQPSFSLPEVVTRWSQACSPRSPTRRAMSP